MQSKEMLDHRILFLSEVVTAEAANDLVAGLLLLDAADHEVANAALRIAAATSGGIARAASPPLSSLGQARVEEYVAGISVFGRARRCHGDTPRSPSQIKAGAHCLYVVWRRSPRLILYGFVRRPGGAR